VGEEREYHRRDRRRSKEDKKSNDFVSLVHSLNYVGLSDLEQAQAARIVRIWHNSPDAPGSCKPAFANRHDRGGIISHDRASRPDFCGRGLSDGCGYPWTERDLSRHQMKLRGTEAPRPGADVPGTGQPVQVGRCARCLHSRGRKLSLGGERRSFAGPPLSKFEI
jgi:hypothetical protein